MNSGGVPHWDATWSVRLFLSHRWLRLSNHLMRRGRPNRNYDCGILLLPTWKCAVCISLRPPLPWFVKLCASLLEYFSRPYISAKMHFRLNDLSPVLVLLLPCITRHWIFGWMYVDGFTSIHVPGRGPRAATQKLRPSRTNGPYWTSQCPLGT